MRSLALCSLTKNICRPALPDGNPEVWFPLCIFFYDSRENFAGKINGVFELYLKKHFNVLGFGEVTKEKVRGHRKIFDNLPVLFHLSGSVSQPNQVTCSLLLLLSPARLHPQMSWPWE